MFWGHPDLSPERGRPRQQGMPPAGHPQELPETYLVPVACPTPSGFGPGVLRYFEMGDLAGLIAPRRLVVVAGEHNPIFPIRAVEETFETIESIYRAAGVPDRCRLVVGPGGHRFYADLAWPISWELSGWGV